MENKSETVLVESAGESDTPFLQKLDEIERKVEQFRLQAQALEQERTKLLQRLQDFQIQSAICGEISTEMKEEIEVNTERLIFRCLTVDVSVVTPRTPAQEGALDRVERAIQGVQGRFENGPGGRTAGDQDQLLSYLNACLPEQARGPIDHKFQGILLQCTADDQKRIRRNLQSMNSLFTERRTESDTGLNISGTSRMNGLTDGHGGEAKLDS